MHSSTLGNVCQDDDYYLIYLIHKVIIHHNVEEREKGMKEFYPIYWLPYYFRK